MRRRNVLTAFGSLAIAWPLAARAQQPALPVIGYLNSGTSASNANNVAAFRRGLKEAGLVEGQHIAIAFRWAENRPDLLPALAADLIHRPVAMIVGNTLAALRAKADRLHDRERPGPRRPRREPRPAGRQRHGRGLPQRRAGDEAIAATTPARTQCGDNCDAPEPEHG
jgi:hypothetical protein